MKVYIGLDVGRQDFCAWIMGEGLKTLGKAKKTDLTEDALKALLKPWKKTETQVAFECGCQARWLLGLIERQGFEVHVFHAAAFDRIAASKRKSDMRDAKEIAIGLCRGTLPPALRLPRQTEALLRDLVHERQRYQKRLLQEHNALSSLAASEGEQLRSGSLDDASWWDEVVDCFPSHQRGRAHGHGELGRKLLDVLGQIDRRLHEAIDNDAMFARNYKYLRTIPGIGHRNACALLAYLGDARRFEHARQVGAFFGLVPSVRQSGKICHLGHVTKQGPGVVRGLLIQGAWAALRSKAFQLSPEFDWCMRLRKKRGNKVAAVALAHRMSHWAWAVIRDGRPWTPQRPARSVLQGEG